MSVFRVEELPEPSALPAALPQDSARSRAAARWAEPVPPTVPGQATPPEPAGGQAVRPEPASRPVARPGPARGQAAAVPLRLTRRGRVVVAVAAALLLAVLSLVIAASAQATNHPLPSRVAQQHLTQVTVRPGQSLWSVADNADPGADTRAVIQQIVELNGLTGDVVFAGQRLWVPRG
ncbi:MAG TPA: LysM peptidoglycan-binding domain-containing protein [Streptosporangiaceae bacterium]|nr:LysM peptidoglycan-binding domain-containing protein [Streptosporangiaceae bacterium]